MTHHYDTLFVYDYVPKGTSIILFIGTWITKEYVPISSETYTCKTIIYILIFSKNRVQMCVWSFAFENKKSKPNVCET